MVHSARCFPGRRRVAFDAGPCRVDNGVDNGSMVLSSPFQIVLSAAEEAAALRARAGSARTEYRDFVRARIVLAAAAGGSNASIAAELGRSVDTVRKWRKRFARDRIPRLAGRRRPGRPRAFTPVQVAGINALACTAPAQKDVPLSRWSSTELAAQAVTEGLVATISAAAVARWLSEDAIKP
jgi:transposase